MSKKLVESVNSLDPSAFFQKYVAPETLTAVTSSTAIPEDQRLSIILTGTGRSLTAKNRGVLEQCLRLIESTSAEDYRKSEIGWSVSKKRKEMRLPDMRYVILTKNGQDACEEPEVAGFVSFMVTYENGKEVIYCFEIHLAERWQGRGIGKKLMAVFEGAGRKVGVGKSMLTVFKANRKAVKMYESLGYGEDEFSPGPRKLRNGTVKEPSYVILSKDLRTAE